MFSFSLEKVLEAITTAGEWRGIERFSPIVKGLRDRSVQLQVSAKYKLRTATALPPSHFSEMKYGRALGS